MVHILLGKNRRGFIGVMKRGRKEVAEAATSAAAASAAVAAAAPAAAAVQAAAAVALLI